MSDETGKKPDSPNHPEAFRRRLDDMKRSAASQESLYEAARLLADAVEKRDPYKLGHQRRVADLARAIAAEMNLTGDQIHGIHLTGAIHDLGKISMPDSLFNKPTRFTEPELQMMKAHAQSGYDLLKDIPFPWPMARMVLEHHERMNGSGYPRGLSGEQLLLESRVLAVADVVDAISSHRTYRPSLGIEAALYDLAGNRGILFDANAANACLRLFHEKHYKMIED